MHQICHDLFRIATRLKAIDADYTVWRNNAKDRFEVHWRGKLAFVVPYQALDVRTLVYAKQTRRENADELEREVDAANAAIMAAQDQKIAKLKAQIKDYVDYDFQRFD